MKKILTECIIIFLVLGVIGYGIYQYNVESVNEDLSVILDNLEGFESVSDSVNLDEGWKQAEQMKNSIFASDKNKDRFTKIKRKYDYFETRTQLDNDVANARFSSAYKKINELLKYTEYIEDDSSDYLLNYLTKIIFDSWWSANCKNTIDTMYNNYGNNINISVDKLLRNAEEVTCGLITSVDDGYAWGFSILTTSCNEITTPYWYTNLSDFSTKLQSDSAWQSLLDSTKNIFRDLVETHLDNSYVKKLEMDTWEDEFYDFFEDAFAFGIIKFDTPGFYGYSRNSTYFLVSPVYIDVDTLTDSNNTEYRGVHIGSFYDACDLNI